MVSSLFAVSFLKTSKLLWQSYNWLCTVPSSSLHFNSFDLTSSICSLYWPFCFCAWFSWLSSFVVRCRVLSSCLSKSSFSSSFLWMVCLSSDTFLSACVSCCLRSSFSRSLHSYADSISDKLLWAASSFSSKSSICPNLNPWSASSWDALFLITESSSSRSPIILRAAFNWISRSFTFSWALAYESSTLVSLLVTRYRSFWISSFSDRSEVRA